MPIERVKRLTRGQGITLEVDDSFTAYFSDAGYRPKYGARELRRVIRSEFETQVARAMLAGEVKEGSTVLARRDAELGRIVLEARPSAPRAAEHRHGRAGHAAGERAGMSCCAVVPVSAAGQEAR